VCRGQGLSIRTLVFRFRSVRKTAKRTNEFIAYFVPFPTKLVVRLMVHAHLRRIRFNTLTKDASWSAFIDTSRSDFTMRSMRHSVQAFSSQQPAPFLPSSSLSLLALQFQLTRYPTVRHLHIIRFLSPRTHTTAQLSHAGWLQAHHPKSPQSISFTRLSMRTQLHAYAPSGGDDEPQRTKKMRNGT
jgi:hypothetical protein